MPLGSCLMEEHRNGSQKWKMVALAGELNNECSERSVCRGSGAWPMDVDMYMVTVKWNFLTINNGR